MEKDMHDDLLLDSMPLNTKQIIFFSTPHRAMSTRGWDRIYANIQEVAQEYSAIARSNSSSQHPNSTDLGSLLQEFDASLTPQTRILSMFEEHDAFNESGPVLVCCQSYSRHSMAFTLWLKLTTMATDHW